MLKRHGIHLPHSRAKRLALGWGLVFGGILGFLPIVGFWMLPLGLAILSVDLPKVRRLRRRSLVGLERRRRKRNGQ
jgi:hypothetical protein